MCSISKELIQRYKNLSAGNIVKFICVQIEGKGGGKADFARGGGSDFSKLNIALEKVIGQISLVL